MVTILVNGSVRCMPFKYSLTVLGYRWWLGRSLHNEGVHCDSGLVRVRARAPPNLGSSRGPSYAC